MMMVFHILPYERLDVRQKLCYGQDAVEEPCERCFREVRAVFSNKWRNRRPNAYRFSGVRRRALTARRYRTRGASRASYENGADQPLHFHSIRSSLE